MTRLVGEVQLYVFDPMNCFSEKGAPLSTIFKVVCKEVYFEMQFPTNNFT